MQALLRVSGPPKNHHGSMESYTHWKPATFKDFWSILMIVVQCLSFTPRRIPDYHFMTPLSLARVILGSGQTNHISHKPQRGSGGFFGAWKVFRIWWMKICLFLFCFRSLFQNTDKKDLWSVEYLLIYSNHLGQSAFFWMVWAMYISFLNIFFGTLVKLHHRAASGNCCWASCSLASTESIQMSSVDIHGSLVYIEGFFSKTLSIAYNEIAIGLMDA